MSDRVKVVTEATFTAEVLEAEGLVLVDFWAPWCGPCVGFAPIIEELAVEFADRVKFVKVNTDENPQLAVEYDIHAIPTLLAFSGGRLVFRNVGFRPKEALRKDISDLLAL